MSMKIDLKGWSITALRELDALENLKMQVEEGQIEPEDAIVALSEIDIEQPKAIIKGLYDSILALLKDKTTTGELKEFFFDNNDIPNEPFYRDLVRFD